MLSAGTWIPGQLATTLALLERNVSLDEKITRMEEFISIVSSCSRDNLGQEMSVSSMLGDATQILCAATVHRKRVGTMRRKMEMFALVASSDRAEKAILEARLHGLELSWRKVERSFLTLSRNWILAHYASTLDNFERLLIGDSDPNQPPTNTLRDYFSTRADIPFSMSGWNKMWVSWGMEVSLSGLDTAAPRAGGGMRGLKPPPPPRRVGRIQSWGVEVMTKY